MGGVLRAGAATGVRATHPLPPEAGDVILCIPADPGVVRRGGLRRAAGEAAGEERAAEGVALGLAAENGLMRYATLGLLLLKARSRAGDSPCGVPPVEGHCILKP